ncbi:MAG: T9SS type A sorting domain-containing protein [Bacteroidota bacterium]
MRICLLLLFCGLSFAQAQTLVTQTIIDEHTTWHYFMSPYLVSNDLEITANGLLQIEAGVEVRFDEGYGFIVKGRLESLGMDQSPVRFGPILLKGEPNWKGIELSGKKASIKLQYTDILLAETGLAIRTSGLDPILVEDCTFGYGRTGILIEQKPFDFTATRNALVQNEIGLEFLTGGTFKRFWGNKICENSQYQAAMRTKEAVSINNNCWCELDFRGIGHNNGILDRRTQAELGYLDISPNNGNTNCNIINPTADYIKGGGDVTVVLDDYVSTQNESPNDFRMLLYPQPMSSFATIDLAYSWRGPLRLSIFDMLGRQILVKDYAESKKIYLDRQMLPNAGTYLIRLQDEKGNLASTTLIVQ